MYSIKDLSMISGLTDRTLRNCLKIGILVGEKSEGVWQFSDEQIGESLDNNYVKAAIKTKRNSILLR